MSPRRRVPTVCPCCGEESLQVDEEYMYSTYSPAYNRMPVEEWTFYCENENCEEAGTIEQLKKYAENIEPNG